MEPDQNWSPNRSAIGAGTAGPGEEINSPGPQAIILLVEDDGILGNLLSFLLNNAGYRVEYADDGEAGWAALSANSFDLLRRIRDHKLHLPIMLISGKVPREVKDFATLLPPGADIEKPFTTAQFFTHVRANLAMTAG